MKSIVWCLTSIESVMKKIPTSLDTEDERRLASNIIDQVEEYAVILQRLINDKQLDKIEKALKGSTFSYLKLQAREIDTLKHELQQLLNELGMYIVQLRQFIEEKNTEEWHTKAKDLAHMIVQRTCDERYEFHRAFEATVYTQRELQVLIEDEKYLAKILQ